MHELSIAQNIVTIVCRVAREEKSERVLEIHLLLGTLSCLGEDALRFAIQAASQGTVAEGALTRIEWRPVVLHCDFCRRDVTLESAQKLQCPCCGRFSAKVVSGLELEVDRIEVEEARHATGGC